jgi:lipopolysaccharide/colanic/teichoic acid biosynthesis glycosyltransferase
MREGKKGPEITVLEDARVTQVGRFLRITSLDELPQLINIVRGDMTLVGARPETLSLANRYPPEARAVFQYRPGLTGPTQLHLRDLEAGSSQVEDVEGYYLSELVPKRVALDLEYLSDANLRRCFVLLLETVAHVARRPLALWRHRVLRSAGSSGPLKNSA